MTPRITMETISRRSVRLGEGDDRPEFAAGGRTTIVVVRAVLEMYQGSDRWDFKVFGYRKERAWVPPGDEEAWSRLFSSAWSNGGLPEALHPLFQLMRDGS